MIKKLYWATKSETCDIVGVPGVSTDLNENIDLLSDIVVALSQMPEDRESSDDIGIIRMPKCPGNGFVGGEGLDYEVLILTKAKNNGTLYVHSTNKECIKYFLGSNIQESNFKGGYKK